MRIFSIVCRNVDELVVLPVIAHQSLGRSHPEGAVGAAEHTGDEIGLDASLAMVLIDVLREAVAVKAIQSAVCSYP